MLTKNQIAQAIKDETGIGTNLIKNVLDELANVAADEIADGNDFSVPGICRISYNYRAPQKKGSRWTKGSTRVGFGGVEQVADSDSPPVKERVTLKAAPSGLVGKLKPSTKPEAQSAFLKTRTAKAVRARKAK